jgi:putative transposase
MPQYRRAKGSVFFFTVALADRHSICWSAKSIAFVIPIDPLNKAAHLKPSQFCVLPDHLHALWEMPDHDVDFSARWSLIKTGFSRGLAPSRLRSASKISKREKGIWQRRYWEHAIRSDDDLARHVDYIHFNPVKHGHVTRVSNWPHSSFHRYVQRGLLAADWGGDMRDISGSFGE